MSEAGTGEPTIEVLLVEDSPGDVRLTVEAFREVDPRVHLNVASDGVEALDFLHQRGTGAGAPRPGLILLDLNLPRMAGAEVLRHIKENGALSAIPTLVLTTSAAETDVARSYELHANCYLVKPAQLDAFESLVRSISDFWLTKATLPQPGTVR